MLKMRKNHRTKRSWDDKLFDWVCNAFIITLIILVLYPLWFVLMASFSDPMYVNNGTFLIIPRGFTLEGYTYVFENAKIWTSYGNTIYYTVMGTIFGTFVTLLAGYAFSRKDLIGGSLIMKLFVFTMYFSGGTIPLYLIIQKLGLLNTREIMIILGSVSVYNIIIVRSFMVTNIPQDLYDAAQIDGCGNGRFFFQVVLPLSKAVIAIMVLYIAVSHWNSYFNAMMYLTDKDKQPLQVFLREILILSSAASTDPNTDPELVARMQKLATVMKYSFIVIATAPILCVYPFIQKHFVKGVMIGSVKG